MWNLYERHCPVDLLTVKDELKKKKLTEKAGGSAYLSELASYVPTAAHAKAYADIVNKAAVRRRLISAAASITENAYDEGSETIELEAGYAYTLSISVEVTGPGKGVGSEPESWENVVE